MDKITIVLGALSVGIGFGLQTIINNLVSGIILAFEKPIQIGDEIQVGLLSGAVKEVGIRTNKTQAYDGSEIILPNGDLLSQSLIIGRFLIKDEGWNCRSELPTAQI